MKQSIFKRAISVIITITMLLSMTPSVFAAKPSDFVDFPTGWSKDAVTAAVANGLLNGRTSVTLEPEGNLTRAEMATIINRAFGAVKTANISMYTDVAPGEWYYTEIAKAVNMQTFQGDATGTMRPDDFITREEVFAVIARALVLESSDFSPLSSHPDGSTVSDWAKPYASILSSKKYINGDQNGNLNPQANITREEFAQIMHNIVKTYYTAASTYTTSGPSSSLIRTSGVKLKDVTIDGDLIIGDGVGHGTVVLENVIIKGRLLCRGGEDSVKLKNTTVGEHVVVKDVNGTVRFDNYRSEKPFEGIKEITRAIFKGESGGRGPSGNPVYNGTVKVERYIQKLNADKTLEASYEKHDETSYTGTVGQIYEYPVNLNANKIPNFTFSAFYTELLGGDSDHKGTVPQTGELLLKLYYTRDTFTYEYDFANGLVNTNDMTFANPSEFDDITIEYEDSFTLPGADSVVDTTNGYRLTGWVVGGNSYGLGDTVNVNEAALDLTNLSIKPIWTKLYRYSIVTYRQKLGSPSEYEEFSRNSDNYGIEGEAVSTTYEDNLTGFIYTPTGSVLEGNVTNDNNFELKVYYNRKDITIKYSFSNGGGFKNNSSLSQFTVPYGTTITLPTSSDVEKPLPDVEGGYDPFDYWLFNGVEYDPNVSATVEIIDYDGEWVFTAIWESTVVYQVKFMSQGSMVGSVKVPKDATVSESTINDISHSGTFNLYVSEGFVKDENISVLYSGNNRYVHTVTFGWYYNALTNSWEPFTNEVPITEEIVNSDGILEVVEKSPKLYFYMNANRLGIPVSLQRYYEPTMISVDEFGNTVVKGTRMADTFKNIMWDLFGANSSVTQSQLHSKIDELAQQGFNRLREQNILDDQNNILKQNFKVKFATIIDANEDEDVIRDYIVDKSKESLRGSNTRLRDAILEYFEQVSKTGTPDDIRELEGLLEETVKGAIENDSEATQLVEDLCEKMLEDSEIVEAAIKELYDIDVTVTETQMNGLAKPTIIAWSKQILKKNNNLLDEALLKIPYNKYYTSSNIAGVSTFNFFKTILIDSKDDISLSSLESNGISMDDLADYIRPYVIDEIMSRLSDTSDSSFFNEIIELTFNGTPFEGYTKEQISAYTTAQFVSTAISTYLNTQSAEEIAIALGYKKADGTADLDALYADRKEETKEFILSKINDRTFFDAHILPLISSTLGNYTYDDFNGDLKTVISMIVEDKLNGSTAAELANDSAILDLLGDNIVIDAVLDEFYTRLETDSSFFDATVSQALSGTEIVITSSNLAGKTVGQFIKEVVGDKVDSITTADELANLAGYEASNTNSAWNNFVDDDANKTSIIDAVESQILDTSSNVYNDIMTQLTGLNDDEIRNIDKKDAFEALVNKILADANDSDVEIKETARKEIAILLGVDYESLTDANILNMQNALDINKDAALDEYIKKAADDNSATFDDFASTREMIAKIITVRLGRNDTIISETLNAMGITGDDIFEQAKLIAKDIINSYIDNDDQNFIKDSFETYVGIVLTGYVDTSKDAKEFIIDVIKSEIGTPSSIDDAFVSKFGYNNLEDFFADSSVRNIMITKSLEKINSDNGFLITQINQQLGLNYTTSTLPADGIKLISDYAGAKIDQINTISALQTQLGFATQAEMLDFIKSVLANKVEADIEDAVHGTDNLKKYINQYTPNYDFTVVPSNSIDFIMELIEGELEFMTWSEIKTQLLNSGYTEQSFNELVDDELKNMLNNPTDEFIVDIIRAVSKSGLYDDPAYNFNTLPAIDFVVEEAAYILDTDSAFFNETITDIFGFVPSDIATETTKDFISDIVIDIFETQDPEHIGKRDKLIHYAAVQIVESEKMDLIEDYIQYAIEHLDQMPGTEPGKTQLDETIDEIIETHYKVTLDTLVDELINSETFTIQPKDSFILEAIYAMIGEYSYDNLKAQIESGLLGSLPDGILDKIFKIYPEDKIRQIYEEPYNNLVQQIIDGLEDNGNGIPASVVTGMTFEIDPVADVYKPVRDNLVREFENKALNFLYYRENPYLRELVTLSSVENLFNGNDNIGYSLKNMEDYYNLLMKLIILGDDALVWYTENLTADQLDELILNYEDVVIENLNRIADFVYDYADDGSLPGQLNNGIVNTVEQAIKSRFSSQLDALLGWYKTSPLYKDYDANDYAKVRQAVRKVFNGINITTDEAIDLVDRAYLDITSKYDELHRIDQLNQINNDTYSITFRGATIVVKRINTDCYQMTFGGRTVKVSRLNNGDKFKLEFEGNIIEMRREISN